MFCNHDWQPRTGMDSGSYCTKCSKFSSKEVDFNSLSGLQNGQHVKKPNFFAQLAFHFSKSTPTLKEQPLKDHPTEQLKKYYF